MKYQTSKLVPLIATGFVPSAVMTPALLSSSARASTGDLDPGFGDIGRLGPILDGPAWSLEPQEDGTMLLAGGRMHQNGYYCYYYNACDVVTTNFVNLVSADGAVDPGFTAFNPEDTQVFDATRQADGQVIAVGRSMGNEATTSQLIAFRLQGDGSIDTTFGDGGTFELPVTPHGNRSIGTSVLLEPDGRIVIAGSRDDQVIVVRLLPNGSPDDSFGISGVFAGPGTVDYSNNYSGARTSLLRAGGGYRVTASDASGCHVVAVTGSGTLDEAFGTAGVAAVAVDDYPTYCSDMAPQSGDRLLVAGTAGQQGFVAQLLADGQPDPGFSADAVGPALARATSIAAADDGSVVVAGTGVSGTTIMRLQASGELDALFGNAGATIIDIDTDYETSTVVRDMILGADGSVTAVGSADSEGSAFVVRLLGDGGGDSPGVVGVAKPTTINTAEGNEEIVVNVRRSGGDSGSVSLSYQTVESHGGYDASIGNDFVGVAGHLAWEDGDRADRQIHVPIVTDDVAEYAETFQVRMSDVQGGAGTGTRNAVVWLAPDGDPHGQLAFTDTMYYVHEVTSVRLYVARYFYNSGPVSVTLTPTSQTATVGSDFPASPVTVSWSDGDFDWKTVSIPIIDDSQHEPAEIFTVRLSNPTGGAVLGPLSVATVRIAESDLIQPNGSGATGYLSLILLGFAALLRWFRAAVGSRPARRRRPEP